MHKLANVVCWLPKVVTDLNDVSIITHSSIVNSLYTVLAIQLRGQYVNLNVYPDALGHSKFNHLIDDIIRF